MKLYIIRKLEPRSFRKSKNYRSSLIDFRVIDEIVILSPFYYHWLNSTPGRVSLHFRTETFVFVPGGCVMVGAKNDADVWNKSFGSKVKRNTTRCRIQPMVGSKLFEKWLYIAPRNAVPHTSSSLTLSREAFQDDFGPQAWHSSRPKWSPVVSEVRNPAWVS